MATSQRNKGNYHEKWWVNWLEERGAKAKRQPLSGQLGGEFGGDIRIETKAGHGAGKPTAKIIEEYTDEWSFLVKNLDMKIRRVDE